MEFTPFLIILFGLGGVFPREDDCEDNGEALDIIRRDFLSFRKDIDELQRNHDAKLQKIHGHTEFLSELVIQQAEEIKRLKQDRANIENMLEELKELVRLNNDDPLDIHIGTYKPESSKVFPMENNNVVTNTGAVKRYLLGPEIGGVAFSATLMQTDVVNLGQGQTIIFDKVISNLGKGYDNNTGFFRVSIAGWYVFSLTLMSIPDETQELDVVLNGVRLFHCYADGNEFNSASRTIVTHANAGDSVWVQTAHWQHSDKLHGREHSSFTGYLLYAD